MGGLVAAGEIINVASGDSFGMEPTAIDNWALTDNHAYPGTESPSVVDGDTVSVVFNNTGTITTDWSVPDVKPGADTISALLMRSSVINEFSVNPTVNSMTDWVVTFPTKHFYVPTNGSPVTRPFSVVWDTIAGESCEPVQMKYWNREESDSTQSSPTGVDFSPQLPSDTPGFPTLCFESNVVTFVPSDADATTYAGVLNSRYQRGVKLRNTKDATQRYYKTGWMQMTLTELDPTTHRTTMTDATDTYAGLPVIGFSVTGKFAPGGATGNYGTEKLHKYTVSRSGD